MIAASTAAAMPRRIVPRRVASSLLSRIDCTFSSSLRYRDSTAAQLPNAWKLHGCPLPPALGSVYEIQWPQIEPGVEVDEASFPPLFVVASYAPQSGLLPFSDQPVT